MLRNRGWDLGDKKGREDKARGDSPGTEYSDSGRSSEHVSPRPPWPRILEHVYKKAMRDLPIAPVRSAIPRYPPKEDETLLDVVTKTSNRIIRTLQI